MTRFTSCEECMEIVAQWLDDLDDLVLALPLILERLRWRCLQVGVLAAVILAGTALAGRFLTLMPALVSVAMTSVLLWAAGFIATEFAHLTGTPIRPKG
jgi:flagellar biosynthesis protein FliQ